MTPQIKESDWRLLRQLQPTALDRYCERVLEEAGRLASKSKTNHHANYLKLYRLLKKRDQDLGIAFDDVRRSNALVKLIAIRSRGLLTDDEYARFSEETRQRVDGALKSTA